jgi:hypothetical protein
VRRGLRPVDADVHPLRTEGDIVSDIREAQIDAMVTALIEVAGYSESGPDSVVPLTPSFHPITFRQVATRLLKAAIEAPALPSKEQG